MAAGECSCSLGLGPIFVQSTCILQTERKTKHFVNVINGSPLNEIIISWRDVFALVPSVFQMTQRSTASSQSSKSSKRKAKSVKENSAAAASDCAVSSSDAEAGPSVSKGPNTHTAAEKQQVRLMVRECDCATENAAIRKEGSGGRRKTVFSHVETQY